MTNPQVVMAAYLQDMQQLAQVHNRQALAERATQFAESYQNLPSDSKEALTIFAQAVRTDPAANLADLLTQALVRTDGRIDVATARFISLAREYKALVAEVGAQRDAAVQERDAAVAGAAGLQGRLDLYTPHGTPEQVAEGMAAATDCAQNHANYDALRQGSEAYDALNQRLDAALQALGEHEPRYEELEALNPDNLFE
ncbi:hypothetical protein KY309_01065 [Candidatus Woesearchaeota archaeon]|nr:hypothetical protein [Candidatus Woesearchaeota archaeon]MBW3016184.1 hypothetical protein [Candidatus Woesearchaeota archaeon]